MRSCIARQASRTPNRCEAWNSTLPECRAPHRCLAHTVPPHTDSTPSVDSTVSPVHALCLPPYKVPLAVPHLSPNSCRPHQGHKNPQPVAPPPPTHTHSSTKRSPRLPVAVAYRCSLTCMKLAMYSPSNVPAPPRINSMNNLSCLDDFITLAHLHETGHMLPWQ